jgi:lipopolysaccharide transport system permease protein
MINPLPDEHPSPLPVFRIRARSGWAALNLAEVWAYRDVLWMLALRDIKLRYRQTALGIVWVVLQPLLAGLIFSVIFGRFAKLPSEGQPYLLFVFAGLMAWNLFNGVMQRAGNSLVAESKLITKVYFPRLIIPLAGALSALVDFTVALVLMVILLIAHHTWSGIWLALLPLALLVNLALAVGLGLWVSALNVRYRDFMYALPFLLQIWMYASPVVYGLSLVPVQWRPWFALNPMSGVLEAFRQAFLGVSSLDGWTIAASLGGAMLALASGAVYFRRVEQEFAEQL